MEKIELLPEDHPNHDLSFKVILIGDAGCGKSALTQRAIRNIFEDNYLATIGFEFYNFIIKIEEKIIKLQILDTCGQEIYRSLITDFYRNSNLVIIVYSIDNKDSFINVEKWLNEFKSLASNAKIFLVGNKSDLNNSRKISQEEGLKFKDDNKLDMFFEVSAKEGNNIANIFIEAAKILYEDNCNIQKNIKIKKEEKEETEEEESEEEEDNETKKEDIEKKCSLVKHKDFKAVYFCPECRIFMCNKCENKHSELFINHHFYKIDNNLDDIFTGFCREKQHFMSLDYYCKTHNKLVCPSCIAKIKGKGNGQHNKCDVCFIKKIKKEKKNLLNENIKYLEEISTTIEKSIIELKDILEKINKNKDELKSKIQNIFTKLRIALNNREDKLLMEVDQKFDELIFKEELSKKFEKMPNIIKESLEKFKLVDNEWNNKKKLKKLINDCINLENKIIEINEIKENIEKCKKNKNIEIKFEPKDDEINKFVEEIDNFGNLKKEEKEIEPKED